MIFEQDLRPGDIVSVRFAGVLRHYGVVTFGGRIVSNSRKNGGVVSQTYEQFAQGRVVERHGQQRHGDDYIAHHRAHRRLGHEYDLTGSNCVHFARSSTRRSPTATQYARGALMAFGDMFGSRRR